MLNIDIYEYVFRNSENVFDVQRNCFVFGKSVSLTLIYEASLELGAYRILSQPFIGPEKRIN
jgi:hypothetical protein